MKIKTPLMSVDARGGFGPGAVFGKYKSTNTGRVRFRTPQPKTKKQQYAKDRLSKSVRGWAEVPAEEKVDWAEYAGDNPRINSMGEQYYPSGSNYFSGYGDKAIQVGEDIETDSPGEGIPGIIPGAIMYYVSMVKIILIYWTKTAEAKYVEIWKTKPWGFGRDPGSYDYYFEKSGLESDGVNAIFDVEEDKYYRVGIRYVRMNGQAGAFYYKNVATA